VRFASLARSDIACIDPASGRVTVVDPPTPHQGARRVWADSRNRVWVSEWNPGQRSVFDPAAARWRSWRLPGPRRAGAPAAGPPRGGVGAESTTNRLVVIRTR